MTFRLAKRGFSGLFLGKLHPSFYRAKRLHVLVNLSLIGLTNATLEALRLVIDKIDHALVGHTLARPTKHPIVNRARICVPRSRQLAIHPRNRIAGQAV